MRDNDGRRALITGITGQDGSYLAEFLLEKGYEVHRHRAPLEHRDRSSASRICDGRIELLQADLLDQFSLQQALRDESPARGLQPRGAELRAHVAGRSRCSPPSSPRSGVTRMLEAIRQRRSRRSASTRRRRREMFGKVQRGAAEREDPVLPAQPLRRRQGRTATSSP